MRNIGDPVSGLIEEAATAPSAHDATLADKWDADEVLQRGLNGTQVGDLVGMLIHGALPLRC